MRYIGVIYTGQLRTIKKTIGYLKKNVLLNENVHIHACLENDTGVGPTTCNADIEDFLKNEIGMHIKTLIWSDKQNMDSGYYKEIMQNSFIHLLQLYETGRPIIEYYQLYMAYKNLSDYEKANHLNYDYIIRTRPDIVICKPLDFHWLDWSDEDILLRKQKIKKLYPEKNLNECFMQTIIHDDLIQNIPNIQRNNQIYDNIYHIYNNKMVYDINFDNIIINKDFIQNGKYIIAIRLNLVYIINRKWFDHIANIYINYGKYLCIGPEIKWFWNAENQLLGACIHSNLLYCHYLTDLEGSSVDNYNSSNYFDENDRIITYPPILFFIMRS